MRVVLFGPPGAGKGTQGLLLKDQLGIAHISSGDLFRFHMHEHTALGEKAAEYITQGQLVPDDVTIEIILDKLAELGDEGFLLDGFPRTVEQAKSLENALIGVECPLDMVLFIDVPKAELEQRLAGRYICRECQAPHSLTHHDLLNSARCDSCGGVLYQRPDDNPDAVRQRVIVYQAETVPVLAFYRDRGLLSEISGLGTVECVNRRALEALNTQSQGNIDGLGSQQNQSGVE